jgi:serine/threonine-protein kinase
VDVARATELGPYKLEERLGRGGMGEVWRANHRLLARPAAVKLIRPRVLEDADSDAAEITLKRFEREAQVTANLTSPYTIELFDFGVTDEGVLYYVMELLEGLDLETLVRNHGPMPPPRVIHVLRQACESLAEAHRTGLIHRDIKPANLVLCHLGIRDDFTKVLDFGLVALRMDRAAEMTQLSTTDAIRGTPHFLAPEIARNEKSADGRADLYCLGCVAFWLLTGKPVFERDGPVQVILAHLNDMPPSVEDIAEQFVPAPLSKLIMECLQKDPADRPPSAEALERRLAEIAERHPWTQDEAKEWWTEHEPAVGPDRLATSH